MNQINENNTAQTTVAENNDLFDMPSASVENTVAAVSTEKIENTIAEKVSEQPFRTYSAEKAELAQNSFPEETFDDGDGYIRSTVSKYLHPGDDANLKKALEIILRENQASISYLQRRMGIGYNKAAELIDSLEKKGIVSKPLPGGQKRKILIFDELNRPED